MADETPAPPVPPSPVGVVDSGGTVFMVPQESLPDLASAGYQAATPQQVALYRAQKEQAGLGGAAKAALQSAADTATFGSASWIEKELGLRTPEDIAGGEAAHPVTSFLGSLGGVAVPLAAEDILASKGLGTLGRIAGGAPGVISDIGEATTGAVRSALGPTSKLGRIGTEVLAHGAGSAIEGAAYGFGQSVTEDALDPDLTVESAFSRGVADSILGAGFGVATGTPLGLVSGALKELPSGAFLADRLEEMAGERRIKATGALQSDIARAAKKVSSDIEVGRQDLIRQANEAAKITTPEGQPIMGRFNSPESIHERSTAVLDDVGQQMRAFVEKTDEAAVGKPKIMGDGQALIDGLRAGPLSELEGNPFQQRAAKTFQGYLDFIQKDMDDTFESARTRARLNGLKDSYSNGFKGRVSVQDLWDLRKQVSEAIYGWAGNQDPNASAIKVALRDFRGRITDEIGQSIERAGQDSAEWKGLNRTYQVASTMQTFSEKGITRAHGNNPFSLTENMAMMTGALHGGPAGMIGAAGYIAARRHGSDAIATLADLAAKRLRGKLPDIPAARSAVEKAASVGTEPMSPMEAAKAPTVAAEPVTAMPRNPDELRAQGFATAAAARSQAMAEHGRGLDEFLQQNPAIGPQLLAKSVALNPAGRIDALAALERQQRTTVQGLRDGMQQLVDKPPAAKATKAPSNDEILKTAQSVNRLANDTEHTARLVTQITDETHEHAPSMTEKTGEVAGRLITYLQGEAPPTSKPFPLGPEIRPGREELLAFHDKVQAVKDPVGTLANHPTPAAISAISVVYPRLLAYARASLVAAIATAGADSLNSRQRQTVSTILGTEMDGSQDPQLSALAQATFRAMSTPAHRNAPHQSVKIKSLSERLTPAGSNSLRNP